MRLVSLLTKLLVFLLLLGFAAKNLDAVAVRYFLGFEWQAPLAFVVLLFFALGVVAGILTALGIVLRQRRELQALRRDLRRQAAAPAVPPLEAL